MDILIFYTVMSAIVGGVIGARARLGEVFEFQIDIIFRIDLILFRSFKVFGTSMKRICSFGSLTIVFVYYALKPYS